MNTVLSLVTQTSYYAYTDDCQALLSHSSTFVRYSSALAKHSTTRETDILPHMQAFTPAGLPVFLVSQKLQYRSETRYNAFAC